MQPPTAVQIHETVTAAIIRQFNSLYVSGGSRKEILSVICETLRYTQWSVVETVGSQGVPRGAVLVCGLKAMDGDDFNYYVYPSTPKAIVCYHGN